MSFTKADLINSIYNQCEFSKKTSTTLVEAAYRKTFDTFDAVIGLEHLYWIHLNDSKREIGTRIDRHEHIGQGFIGETAFKLLMNDSRLQSIPKVLETPKGKGEKDWDQINLKRLRDFGD